jgi:hypothetical protein
MSESGYKYLYQYLKSQLRVDWGLYDNMNLCGKHYATVILLAYHDMLGVQSFFNLYVMSV